MAIPLQLGSFEVHDEIGAGGMGAVYRGEHRETEVPVAVKVVKRMAGEGAREKFHEEVQAHARLRHPGIVYLFEYGEVEDKGGVARRLGAGNPYVAMELADQTVRDEMPFTSWQTVYRLLVQILDALAHAHARGVVHRDLKPENFLWFDQQSAGRGGARVKLADFGIAHTYQREREASRAKLTSTAGTPYYMAPEQLRGDWRRYGPWTDLYALGCITWRLVSGAPPFDADNLLSIARQHGEDERPPLDPQFPVPDGLEAWVHRAMAIEPERRFRRAAEALRALPSDFAEETATGGEPSTDDASVETAPTLDSADGIEPTLDPEDGIEPTLDSADGVEPTLGIAESQTVTLSSTAAQEPSSEIARSATLPGDAADEMGEPGAEGSASRRTSVAGERPPVPDDWRPEATDPVPAPLVGAGLGLFGLREPPFVDREEPCEGIWEALQRVVDRGGTEIFFAAGDAGTGKSRLAEWMSMRAHELGVTRTVRAFHTPGGGPHEGLAGAMERALRTLKLPRGELYEHLCDQLPRLEEDDEEAIERDARAATEYLRPTDDDAGEVDGPRYRFSSAEQRRSLVVRLLARLALHRPIILWVDDLQWGDETMGVLEHLQEMEDAPEVLVLATLRSDVLADQPSIRTRLTGIEQTSGSERVTLEPLSRKYQRELLQGLLPLEDELADRLAERTEGHPLFAMQLLGHWIERGALEVGADGFRVPADREVELPGDIHALWMERIGRLLDGYHAEETATTLEALELAATLGREVDGDEWRHLLEESGTGEPSGLVRRLVDRGLAERTSGGWSFAHGLLADSIRRRAGQAGRLEAHHRRCARMLEATATADEPGPRERAAEHWVAADEPARALEPLLDEIGLVRERRRNDDIERLLERRADLLDELELPEDDPRRLAQNVERAQRLEGQGEPERARDMLQEVWEQIEPEAEQLRARVADQMTFVETTLGDFESAREWGHETLERSRRADLDDLEGQAHQRLAWLDYFEGNLEEAERHAERARELADSEGDRFARVESMRLEATVGKARGDEAAGELFERVHREATEAGYVGIAAQAVNGLGHRARYAGRLDEARRYYLRYLEKIRELSRPTSEPIAEMNLAMTELRAGRPEVAESHLESAERGLEEVGGRDRWTGLIHLMYLAHAAGAGDEAKLRRRWEPLADGWPEDWNLSNEHPWLVETAARFLEGTGCSQLTREMLRLAGDLWAELGNDEAVERLEGRLEEQSGESGG
jgi:serine/threonine protein kinase/tetratricopeptide (TPR) repeat protein